MLKLAFIYANDGTHTGAHKKALTQLHQQRYKSLPRLAFPIHETASTFSNVHLHVNTGKEYAKHGCSAFQRGGGHAARRRTREAKEPRKDS